MVEFGFFLMYIRIKPEKSRSRDEFPQIIFDLLYTDTDRGESRTVTLWTDMRHSIDIVTEMTDDVFLWTRMVGERDVTVWACWKISTVLADPCSS